MALVTTPVCPKAAPSASPGKMYLDINYQYHLRNIRSNLLLHWDEATSLPLTSTSGKGDPLAKIALPPQASCACWAVHSDLGKKFIFLRLTFGSPWSWIRQWKYYWWSLIFIHAFQNISLTSPPQADKPEVTSTRLIFLHLNQSWLPMILFGLTFLTVSKRDIPSMLGSSTAELSRS